MFYAVLLLRVALMYHCANGPIVRNEIGSSVGNENQWKAMTQYAAGQRRLWHSDGLDCVGVAIDGVRWSTKELLSTAILEPQSGIASWAPPQELFGQGRRGCPK